MQLIEQSLEQGSISGYVVFAKEPNIKNYLEQHTNLSKAISSHLERRGETVALLKNLYVDPDSRGQGVGGTLLTSFLEEAGQAGATAFILICDEDEGQNEGFDLQAWYEDYGFCGVVSTGSGPLMVIPEELAESLIELLGPEEDPEDDQESSPSP